MPGRGSTGGDLIYIFDVATSEVLGTISDLAGVPRDIEFSPDGRTLASVFHTSSGEELTQSGVAFWKAGAVRGDWLPIAAQFPTSAQQLFSLKNTCAAADGACEVRGTDIVFSEPRNNEVQVAVSFSGGLGHVRIFSVKNTGQPIVSHKQDIKIPTHQCDDKSLTRVRPSGVAFSEQNKFLAVGTSSKCGPVHILEQRGSDGYVFASNLFGGASETSGVGNSTAEFGIFSVAWMKGASTGADTLFASGSLAERVNRNKPRSGKIIAKIFQKGAAGGETADLPLNDVIDSTMGTIALSQSRLLIASQDPAIGVYQLKGGGLSSARLERMGFVGNESFDFRTTKFDDEFRVCGDGSTVQFGRYRDSNTVFEFDLSDLRVGSRSKTEEPLCGAQITQHDQWNLKTKAGRLYVDDALVWESPIDFYRVRRISSDGSMVAIGSSFSVRLIKDSGNEVIAKAVDAEIWRIGFSEDNKYVVAAARDGTLRWFTTKDLTLTLTVHLDKDGERWGAWTPAGKFFASLASHSLYGWRVSSDIGEVAGFSPLAACSDESFSPIGISQALIRANEAQNELGPSCLQSFERIEVLGGKTYGKDISLFVDLKNLPATEGEWSGSVDGASVLGVQVDDISQEVLVGGLPENGQTGDTFGKLNNGDPGLGFEHKTLSLVAPGNCRSDTQSVSLFVGGGSARLQSETILVPCKKESDLPHLNAIVVGINEYDGPGIDSDLKFAVADAIEFARALKSKEGQVYRSTSIYLHLDAENFQLVQNQLSNEGIEVSLANREVILNRIKSFAESDANQDSSFNSQTIVYFAGHGEGDSAVGFKYFMPQKAATSAHQSVSGVEIAASLTGINGPVIAFFDFCRTQKSDFGARELEQIPSGEYFFSTSPRYKAWEDEAWQLPAVGPPLTLSGGISTSDGHGAFTYLILKVLTNHQDYYDWCGNTCGTEISTFDLWNYLNKNLPSIVDRRKMAEQVPVWRPSGSGGFVISQGRR